MRLRFLLTAALVLSVAIPALADTVYTYNGNDFTTASGLYTTGDKVTGSFTVASPLGDSFALQQVFYTSFSFSDGVQTITNLSYTFAPIFDVATDLNGNISHWDIELNVNGILTLFNNGYDTDLVQDESAGSGLGSASNSDVGSWLSATVTSNPPGVTPEPSSLTLLGTGLLGALGAARRRFTSSPASASQSSPVA